MTDPINPAYHAGAPLMHGMAKVNGAETRYAWWVRTGRMQRQRSGPAPGSGAPGGQLVLPGNWPVSGFQVAHRTETKDGAEHVRNPLLDVDAGGRAGPG